MGVTHGSVGKIFTNMPPYSGGGIPITNAQMTNTGDNKRYFITNEDYRAFAPSGAFTVQKSTDSGVTWTTVSPTLYTIEHAGGYVVFASANTPTTQIRISSGFYIAIQEWLCVLNWRLDLSVDLQDITNFSTTDQWKEFIPGIKSVSGSAEALWLNNVGETGITWVSSDYPLRFFALYVDSGTSKIRYEGYGRFVKDGLSVSINEVVKEKLDFVLDKVYYRAG